MKILTKNKNKKPHPSKLKGHGAQGEKTISRRLLHLTLLEGYGKQIDDIIIVDDLDNSHQIDHIIIRENGVFVIETKNWAGLVVGKADSRDWIVYLNKEKYIQYNPVIQNRAHCKCVSDIIGDNYVINSVIVMFQNNGKKLGIPNVVNGCSLKRYIREFDNGVRLSNEDIDIIYRRLIDASSDMTREEHIENINNRA